jgi:hypothetical protein
MEGYMKAKLTLQFALILLGMLTMGASSCVTHPSLVGDWQAKCDYTNPVDHKEFYWRFGELNPAEQGEFRSWEPLADGEVDFYFSFYMYQKGFASIKDPYVENNDKVYAVTEKDTNHLYFKGVEYTCYLERTTIPYQNAN